MRLGGKITKQPEHKQENSSKYIPINNYLNISDLNFPKHITKHGAHRFRKEIGACQRKAVSGGGNG